MTRKLTALALSILSIVATGNRLTAGSVDDPVTLQSIADAAYVAWRAEVILRTFPDDPAAWLAVEATHVAGSPALEVVRQGIDSQQANGWTVSESPTTPGRFSVEFVETRDGPSSGRGRVMVCVVVSEIVRERPSGELIDDTTYAFRGRVDLRLVGDTWMVYETAAMHEPVPGTECPVPTGDADVPPTTGPAITVDQPTPEPGEKPGPITLRSVRA